MTEPAPNQGRMPPNDPAAEAAVLSAMTLGGAAVVDRVREIAPPSAYFNQANRWICEACFALADDGAELDVITVQGWLRDRERLNQAGGIAYLVQITDATPSVGHVEDHARRVRDKARVRAIIRICQEHAAAGYGDVGDEGEWIQALEQRVYDAARENEHSLVIDSITTQVHRTLDGIAERRRTKTTTRGAPVYPAGLAWLVPGWQDGLLYIVAGRPSHGKTAFVLNQAVHVAASVERAARDVEAGRPPEQRYGVVYFGIEMPEEQIIERLIAAEARVNLKDLGAGKLSAADWQIAQEQAERIRKLPITIIFKPKAKMSDVRSGARRAFAELQREHGPDLKLVLLVDYIQIMDPETRRQDTREQEVSRLSGGLLALAGELRCPVLALSQLNRDVEKRKPECRPQLSDLRDTGSLEQDAFTVMFIYRQDLYRKTGLDGCGEVIVGKQRQGPLGSVKCRYAGQYTRFDEVAGMGGEEFDGNEFDEEARYPT